MTVPDQIRLSRPAQPLDDEVLEKLRTGLDQCADLAFAHLVDVDVLERDEGPSPALFVWLVPGAMKSLRQALNLVSEIVSDALPPNRYLDVLILNSVPELLPDLERVEGPFVERDPDERRKAIEAVGR